MTDINSDPMGPQRKTLAAYAALQKKYDMLPKQNNYEMLIGMQRTTQDEIFWLRASYDDQVNQIFDLTELIGRLAEKIEQWIGVAEE